MDYHFYTSFLSAIEQSLNAKIFRIRQDDLWCDFVLVKSFLFGNRLISLGYLTEGGIEGRESQSQDSLLNEINQLAYQHKVDYIEFRGGIKPNVNNIIQRDNIYANFTKDFSDIDNVLLSIPRKKRADVRHAIDNKDLEFTNSVSIDDFYHLFSIVQHQHGTPIHHKKYYKSFQDNQNLSQTYGVTHQGKIVAVCMVFFTETELIAYYGASDKNYLHLHIYDLMYYHLMMIAKEKNLIFNFGRSKYQTGSFRYKELFGFEAKPTTHYIIPISNKKVPDLRANNPEFSKKIDLWRKMPLWLVNLIGSYILKQIG